MLGMQVTPHHTLKNEGLRDVVKNIHNPVRYTQRYNYEIIDELLEEGKAIDVKGLFKGGFKELIKSKSDTDLLFVQNNFIYEIEITQKDVAIRVLSDDLDKINRIYTKYIPRVKLEAAKDYKIDISKDMDIAEMVLENHFMFSLKTHTKGLEPLKYILDIKRQLKEGEKFIYQVILHSLNNDWWQNYAAALKKFREGIMPKKVGFKASDAAKLVGDLALNTVLGAMYVAEEFVFGEDGVNRVDITQDAVAMLKQERGLSGETMDKGTQRGFETSIRGIIYSKSQSKREDILRHFANCFTCLEADNNLHMKRVKKDKNNLNRVRNREVFFRPLTDSKNILSTSEVENLLQLPQIMLQREFDISHLEFNEIPLPEELTGGYIPLGSVYGSPKTIATFPKVKDLLCFSKAIVSVKGAGKSKYLEKYVYNAYRGGDCVVYFDYIENNANAKEVAKHIPKNDTIILDLSKGFTFDYPELDITNLPIKNDKDEHIRTLKEFASKYCKLLESFINTINSEDAEPLSADMRNILIAAASFTFLSNNNDMYSIYKMLTNHIFRNKVVEQVKQMGIYNDDDFRFLILAALNDVTTNKAGKSTVTGTNKKADRVLARFNALLRDSRTEEMLVGINRNNVNFVDIFEQNKAVMILMPEEYFSDYELKDIVVTYFLSRMWLSAIKRAALIPDREKRKVVHIIMDEIHQLENARQLMIKNIAEDRKFRTTYVFTCQYLGQFGKLWEAIKGTGCNFMLLAGCEKQNFKMLEEEIGSEFELEELMQMPAFHSLNIIRGRENPKTTFITELPKNF